MCLLFFNVKYANSYFCFLMSVDLCAAVCVCVCVCVLGVCTDLKASVETRFELLLLQRCFWAK